MLSIQEISDRLEIQDLLARYCDALDRKDWDIFDRIFTPDAVIDYTAMGGSCGDLTATKKFLADTMPVSRRARAHTGRLADPQPDRGTQLPQEPGPVRGFSRVPPAGPPSGTGRTGRLSAVA